MAAVVFVVFSLGSVANEVLHDTECPLLTEVHRAEVSREFEPYRRVTCAA